MILGFTETQKGMSDMQKEMIRRFLRSELWDVTEVHHGDCIGADADMHSLAEEFDIYTVIHPPSNPSKRAFCKGDKVLTPRAYIRRNHDIVKACDVLIATPWEYEEVMRSGTWATIRNADRTRKTFHIVFTDGSIKNDLN